MKINWNEILDNTKIIPIVEKIKDLNNRLGKLENSLRIHIKTEKAHEI